MKNKLFYILSWSGIVGAMALILISAFWTFYPYKPMKIYEVINMDNDIEAGGQLIYRVTYCKYTNMTGTISKTLVNHILIPFTPYQSNLPVGCNEKYIYQDIPTFTPSGEYHLHISSRYLMNPIRHVDVEYETPTFTVTNKNLK